MTRRAPGGPIRLDELARACGACVEGDGATPIERVATLEGAGPGDLAFLANPRYRAQLAATRASAVIVAPAAAQLTPLPRLVAADPYVAYAKAASVLYPREAPLAGRHPAAIVDPAATVAATAAIGPLAVVGAGASIGARASIGSHCSIGEDAVIGDDAVLDAGVRVYPRCTIGPRTLVHSGAVIGADGFGLAPGPEGWIKIPQVGRVVVGADVEIGANTTIDRGAIGDTVIENGVKIDNLVQVAHNVRIGEHTVLAAYVGISGSATIGRRCMLAGMVGVAGHLEICDDVVVTGRTTVAGSIRKPGVYSGSLTADDARRFRRNAARFNQLDELARRLRRLEEAAGTTGEGDADE